MDPVDAKVAWLAVLKHDRQFDGHFVYAVSSTRIYCRPSCPSRRPARHRVSFFPSAQQAETAGFRACLRCQPQSDQGSLHEQRIEQARQYLEKHPGETVTLRRLADQVGLSPFHLQRAFQRSLGLSPKAYQDATRIERFTALLKCGESVTNATYEAGYGSSSRVAERVTNTLGMTPSSYRSGGNGVTLRYTTVGTLVGRMLIAKTERGVVSVSLGHNEDDLVALLRKEYPQALLSHDPKGMKPEAQALLQCLNGERLSNAIPFDLQGTAFQRNVWKALRDIPRGSTRTYREIACEIGQPTAARAVARATATNPLAVAIPCHRVVRGDGHLAGYRWGLKNKKRLLALEQERQED
ncbi:MAG: bifunctional transcriptional regulator/O6-methylguanine-DNA methyltransferase [Nitrospira sp. ST-bin5]|nr:MAG: bifunctional transcriptional regulator/O6-methylguanine-DNA methyltransferase [Nitrospira sp. ST-bin5]